MRRAIYLAIILSSSLSLPVLAQVSATVSTNVGAISATASPTFLAPVETVNPTTFLSPAAVTSETIPFRTTGQTLAPNPTVTSVGQEGAATNSFAGTPFQAASQGSTGNTSYMTGEGPQGEYHVQNLADKTTQQLTNLNLPRTGTMGLAPVFGTGHDGLTSPGGYTPVIYIPFVGSFRIPSTVALPGGGAVGLPAGVTNPSALVNTLTGQ